jgi:transcription elongation GreA/GreB family factor
MESGALCLNSPMSRALVKETASDAPPLERMVEEGANPVTETAMAQIVGHVARIEDALKSETNVLLRETLERDLRYWQVKQASAQVTAPREGGTVAFGSDVVLSRNGRTQRFRIVGADGADPARGLVSVRAPLAQAVIGARAGDVIEADAPLGEITIVSVAH